MTDTPFELQRKTLQRLKALQDAGQVSDQVSKPVKKKVKKMKTTGD